MKLIFFYTFIILFLDFNCQVLTVVFGETLSESKVSTYYKDLQDNNNLEDDNEKSNTTISGSNVYSRKSENVENSPWYTNIPLLPVIVATSSSIPEGSCKRQLQLYLNHLKNGTLWATEMFDASAKYPYGIFNGFTRHLGSFDQCDRIQTIINNNDGEIEEIRSRYCLVDVKFREKLPTNFTGELDLIFDPHISAWEAVKSKSCQKYADIPDSLEITLLGRDCHSIIVHCEKGDFRRFRRYLLQMALCFPATCHTEEIVTALKQPLDEFGTKYNMKIEASILPIYCASKEAPQFSSYDIIFYLTFGLMLTIVVISTIIDTKTDRNEEFSLLLCFSARKNFNEIFKVNYAHPGFDSIHFFRAIVTLFIIISHRQYQYMYVGTISGSYLEWVLSHYSFGITHNSTLMVDGFFALGGLLLSFSLLSYWNEKETFNFVLLILKRLVRILPLFLFLTFAYATLFHRLGSGPFWESTMGFHRDSCSSYWWTNLLFINNYFGGNNKCVIQGWYLAVDFQCYIIGLFLIRAFYKTSRKIGYTFLGSILILSSGIPFYSTYQNNLDAFARVVPVLRRIEEVDYFLNYYVKTQLHLSAYITGLIVGAFLYDHKKANWRLPKNWSRYLFNIAIVGSLSIMWIGTLFTNPNWKISAFQKALYASLQRPIIALSICSIPLLLTVGDGLDFYYNILAAKWLQPLSRLSYALYLVNFVIYHYEIGVTKTTFTFSFYNTIKNFVTDIVYSVTLALFVALVIEFPIKNAVNVLLMRKKNSMIQSRSTNSAKKME